MTIKDVYCSNNDNHMSNGKGNDKITISETDNFKIP